MARANLEGPVKARTRTPIHAGSALESTFESADPTPETADSSTDFLRVGQLPILNMFDNYVLIQLAPGDQLTLAILKGLYKYRKPMPLKLEGTKSLQADTHKPILA